MDISFSYAKILGEIHYQPREFPRSGSKAKDGEEKERKKEREKERLNLWWRMQNRLGQNVPIHFNIACHYCENTSYIYSQIF